MADCALQCQWIYGTTVMRKINVAWVHAWKLITVSIMKHSRETIPHIRTANRKCTLPELNSCSSYGGGSGSWRSEVTSLWVCRVKCYQVGEVGRQQFRKIWCISVAILNVTRCLTGSQCSCCSAGLMCARRSNSAPVERPRFALIAVAPGCMQVDRQGLSCSSQCMWWWVTSQRYGNRPV